MTSRLGVPGACLLGNSLTGSLLSSLLQTFGELWGFSHELSHALMGKEKTTDLLP